MKKLLVLAVIALCSVQIAVAQKIRPSEYSGNVNLVSEGKGTVTVRSMGYGKNEAISRDDAEMRAIKTILFVGLPGSSKNGAMIGNEGKAISENEGFFTELLENKGYKRFIKESVMTGRMDKVKGEKLKSVSFDITIDTNALRRDLEHNDVIRKFGF